MLAKENALVLPLLVFATEGLRNSGGNKRRGDELRAELTIDPGQEAGKQQLVEMESGLKSRAR